MKRYSVALVTFVLILTYSFAAMGAIYSDGKMKTDTWYTVEGTKPFMEVACFGYDDYSYTWFQNSQTFFNLDGGFSEYSQYVSSKGGALLPSGLFVGGYGYFYHYDYNGTYTNITWVAEGSVGFRYVIPDGNLAASFDLGTSSSGDWSKELALEGKYNDGTLQVVSSVNFYGFSMPTVNCNTRYKMSDNLTVGGGIAYSGTVYFNTGLTYREKFYVIDASFAREQYYSYPYFYPYLAYHVSGMCNVGDKIGVGAEYNNLLSSSPLDGWVVVKARLDLGDGRVILAVNPLFKAIPETINLVYQKNL